MSVRAGKFHARLPLARCSLPGLPSRPPLACPANRQMLKWGLQGTFLFFGGGDVASSAHQVAGFCSTQG